MTFRDVEKQIGAIFNIQGAGLDMLVTPAVDENTVFLIPRDLADVVRTMDKYPQFKEEFMTLQSKLAAEKAARDKAARDAAGRELHERRRRELDEAEARRDARRKSHPATAEADTAPTRADARVPKRLKEPNPSTAEIAETLVAAGVTGSKLEKIITAAEDAATGAAPASEVLDPDTFEEFDAAVSRYKSLDGKIKALEAKKSEVKVIITEIIESTDNKTLLLEDWSVTKVAGAWRESLDRKLLMDAGVTVEQLEKGTVRKQTAGHVQVKQIEAPPAPKSEAERMAPKLPSSQIKKVRK